MSAQSANKEHDGGDIEEGSGRRERGLRVLLQPPVPADPTEEPLDHLSARVDREPT